MMPLRTTLSELNTVRRIGIRVCRPSAIPMLAALTIIISVGPAAIAQMLGADMKIVFVLAVAFYMPGMFAPALLGWRYLKQVEREFGKSVRKSLVARYAGIRPGAPVPFTLQQVIDDVRAQSGPGQYS